MIKPSEQLLSNQKAQAKAVALFVSDVHLCDALPRTTRCFLNFLQDHALQAEQVFLLGDLFEYWAGDDDVSPYNQKIVDALHAVNEAGVKLFWIAGNRDFLVGEDFARQTGVQLLNDPSELVLAGRHLLISHGDALCTDDLDYMAFRAMVRRSEWQTQFLSKALSERKAIIEGMRKASSQEQKNKTMAIMDVNQTAVSVLCQEYPGATLIHGHTHRTAIHTETYATRYVLPDWDCEHITEQRGGFLRLDADGSLQFIDITFEWQAGS